MQGFCLCNRLSYHPESYRPAQAPATNLLFLRRTPHRPVAAAASSTLVGIDLGTSNSAISVVKDGRVQILPDEQGNCVTPSLVAYTQDAVAVGAAVHGSDAANTFYSVKRLIGRSLAEVAADVAGLRYEVCGCDSTGEALPASADVGDGDGVSGRRPPERNGDACEADGGLRLWCPARGVLLRPEEVSAELLRHLLARAQAHLGTPITNAVVTVPAHFGPARRQATHRAARLAGLQAVHLLQEPVAAAIAYGLGRPQDADTILVVDLGGGTLDVSILESFEGILEVLATDGDSELGGDDFDRAVAHWALDACRRQGHAAGDADISAVMPAAEAAKVALSSAADSVVSVPLPDGQHLEVPISRGDFEAAVQPLLRRVWAVMQRAGNAVFLEWADRPFVSKEGTTGGDSSSGGGGLGRFVPPPRRVTKALLVGGGTHVPAVRQLVERATGIAPHSGLDPELFVALGAGMQAGILVGELEGPLEVMDGAYVQNLHGRTTGVAGFDTV